MAVHVEERMRELEQAILTNESEPNRLKRVARYIELANRAVEPIVEETRNDPEMREKEDAAAYLLAYLEYALLLHQGRNGHSTEPKDTSLDALIEYKGNVIDLVELGMALYLTKDFYVNGKPITQEFIGAAIEKHIGIPMDNFSGKVQDLKKRKNDPVAKLNAMTKALLSYLGRLPDDRSRKK